MIIIHHGTNDKDLRLVPRNRRNEEDSAYTGARE